MANLTYYVSRLKCHTSQFTFHVSSVLLFSALLLSACNFSLAADVTPPPGYQQPTAAQAPVEATSGPLFPIVPPDPAKGETIFAEKCAPCHGVRGLGDGSRADELPNPVSPVGTTEVAHQATPTGWFSIVSQGNLERFMPPFQSLTDRQRWDVVAYMFSLSASKERVAQGDELFQANCTNCHGEGGKGNGPDAANLPTQPPDFSNQAYMAERSANDFFQVIVNGLGPNMPAFGDEFSEDEAWALTDYLRSLTFASAVAEAPAEATITESDEGEQSILTPEGTPISAVTETVTTSETVELGTISGIVTNNSGGQIPPDLIVTLHGFDNIQLIFTDTANLQEDGTYIFQDVEMMEGRMFLTTVDFEGTIYGSDVATSEPGLASLELPIQVYETTTDSSVLVVDRLHIFLELFGEETLRVAELYIISNPSTSTLVAPEEGQPTITFSVPEEATNLNFQDGVLGGRFIETPDGFGDTLAIRPGAGDYQVLFFYEMPYKRKLELVRPVNLAVDAVVIMAPENGLKIKGNNLQDAGTREVEGAQYRMFSLDRLTPGEEIRLTITGHPTGDGTTLTSGSNTGLLIGLGALGIALVGAGVWLYLRNKDRETEVEPAGKPAIPVEPTPENTETIMDAILALDDLYQEGHLPEEAYHQRRKELKARLKQLMDE